MVSARVKAASVGKLVPIKPFQNISRRPAISGRKSRLSEDREANFWDNAYRSSPPWEIGRPQPAIVELVRDGELEPGRVLDIGCGTGENAIFLAEKGYMVTGVDASSIAIETAKAKSRSRRAKVEFRVSNALGLDRTLAEFDNVTDSGLFHTFYDNERPIYAQEIAQVLREAGRYFMLCFSEREPTDWGGPRRVTKREIQETFSPLFSINYIRDAFFATRVHDVGGKAYLTSATKRKT
jgi:SAM-dependent methyltransferase